MTKSFAQAAISIPTAGPSPTSPFGHRPPAITGPAPAKVVDRDHSADPPKHLVDHIITQDLIDQAVITPSGHTYDRKVIEKWIKINGTCPITRKPLPKSELRPNRAIQNQINEWKAMRAGQGLSY